MGFESKDFWLFSGLIISLFGWFTFLVYYFGCPHWGQIGRGGQVFEESICEKILAMKCCKK